MTDLARAHALVVRLRSGDPRANFWKICADTIEAQASEIGRLRARLEAVEQALTAMAKIEVDDGG
jgi:hypothetical protein